MLETKVNLIETVGPKRFNWVNFVTLTSMPIIAIGMAVAYIFYNGFVWTDLATFFVMSILTGLATTAGYHRYYSHRAYDCHPIVQFFYLTFGAASLQNSLLNWASNHRFHHRYVDDEADPYNINKGFFWAHIGWIFYDEASGTRTFSNLEDLKKSKLVQWQHRHYLLIAIIVGLGLPTLIGAFFGRPLSGFIFGGLLRCVWIHHCVFLINSAAHVFGKQPYSTQHTAKDNWFLAFFTYGEGYHNFHHTYPSDYRNGVRWYHWDPTKWWIAGLQLCGLATNLKRTSKERRDRPATHPTPC